MRIKIDPDAGFCFGVVNAVRMVEDYLKEHDYLYCLGDLVHNPSEVERLSKLGLRTINREEFSKLHNETVLIRAHGEPEDTYKTAWDNDIALLEGTCPIVVRLQNMVKRQENGDQVIIFGKKNHPESIGLASRVKGHVQVVQTIQELEIDSSRPVKVFSQTTMDAERYHDFCSQITGIMKAAANEQNLFIQRSVCARVSNRALQLRKFVANYDLIIFVSGKQSSNGRYLFSIAKSTNPNSYFVSEPSEINANWFEQAASVGISGATSTPIWLMENVKKEILELTA